MVGGGRPAHLDKGYYVEPTLFADVDNSMTIAQEEIFGPVLVVVPFDDDDDAVRLANENEYGLGVGVTSGSEERALAVARRVRAGTAGINGGIWYGPDAPFGGYKVQWRRSPERPRGLRAVHRDEDLRRRAASRGVATVTGPGRPVPRRLHAPEHRDAGEPQRGRPRPCSARMLRLISLVPPAMEVWREAARFFAHGPVEGLEAEQVHGQLGQILLDARPHQFGHTPHARPTAGARSPMASSSRVVVQRMQATRA